jgi:hypothetical protein
VTAQLRPPGGWATGGGGGSRGCRGRSRGCRLSGPVRRRRRPHGRGVVGGVFDPVVVAPLAVLGFWHGRGVHSKAMGHHVAPLLGASSSSFGEGARPGSGQVTPAEAYDRGTQAYRDQGLRRRRRLAMNAATCSPRPRTRSSRRSAPTSARTTAARRHARERADHPLRRPDAPPGGRAISECLGPQRASTWSARLHLGARRQR